MSAGRVAISTTAYCPRPFEFRIGVPEQLAQLGAFALAGLLTLVQRLVAERAGAASRQRNVIRCLVHGNPREWNECRKRRQADCHHASVEGRRGWHPQNDDAYYYKASVIAERLRIENLQATVVTPESKVCAWGEHPDEQHRSQKRLLGLGVKIITAHGLSGYDGEHAKLQCIYTRCVQRVTARGLVTITARNPDDAVYHELARRIDEGAPNSPRSLSRIGNCAAPTIIAGAIFAGHRYAREFEASVDADNPLSYDRVFFEHGSTQQ